MSFRNLILPLLGSMSFHVAAQTQQVLVTFTDTSRADRAIPVDFRYDESTAPGPLVLVAHGFVMGPADYDDLADALVSEGYVVGLLDTETGFAASHEDYGLDLVHVIQHASYEAPGISGWLEGPSGIVGHSMGGGAAWLAGAELGLELGALVGLAPAETTPSAMDAGPAIQAPTMVVSGTADEVTPPELQHVPLHDALTSTSCRAFVSLEGGGHCGFADAGSLCDFGELLFNGMSREEQQGWSFDAVKAWLNAHLKDVSEGLAPLEAMDANATVVELSLECETSAAGERAVPAWTVVPNPATSEVRLQPTGAGMHVTRDRFMAGSWTAWDAHGRSLPIRWLSPSSLDLSAWPRGVNVLVHVDPSGVENLRARVITVAGL